MRTTQSAPRTAARWLFALLAWLWMLPALAEAPAPPPAAAPETAALRARPPGAAIASAHALATEAGHEMLAAGGNAFDAAVAVAAVLAVVEPYGSGLGGGGFFLLHRAGDGFETLIDARERAPLAASEDMYLDAQRNPIARASLDGPLAAAIPGTPAALAHLAQRYGRLPLKHTLAPAIRLAREGVPVGAAYRQLARLRREALAAYPDGARVFLEKNAVPGANFVLRQPELAATLERLAAKGHDGFYGGTLAQQLVHGVRAAGGIWSLKDLAAYRVLERTPLRGEYRGVTVTSAPLPSSGGTLLLTMLKLLEDPAVDKASGTARVRALIEAMRLAYRVRAEHLGDADFVEVDVDYLLGERHLAALRREYRERLALAPAAAPAVQAGGEERKNTTHFSILDADGNRVAATLSINSAFGSGFVVPGTGVLLNNEMDDFVIKPGSPNLYGLTGARANLIAPGKRPLSSMTPTFLETPETVALLGTPGGSRIITMVLLATLDFADGRDVHEWVSRPRLHHQYLPDVIEYEAGALTAAEAQALAKDGYALRPLTRPYGNMQAVVWRKAANAVEAVADPRGEGAARVVRPSAGSAEE